MVNITTDPQLNESCKAAFIKKVIIVWVWFDCLHRDVYVPLLYDFGYPGLRVAVAEISDTSVHLMCRRRAVNENFSKFTCNLKTPSSHSRNESETLCSRPSDSIFINSNHPLTRLSMALSPESSLRSKLMTV